MKFGRIVLQENTHRLTRVGYSIWRHAFKMAAPTSFQATKCCHLDSEHEASARCLCISVRQFLIYSTFVLVKCQPGIDWCHSTATKIPNVSAWNTLPGAKYRPMRSRNYEWRTSFVACVSANCQYLDALIRNDTTNIICQPLYHSGLRMD